jgi:branched-chain amino acid transport system permease protein
VAITRKTALVAIGLVAVPIVAQSLGVYYLYVANLVLVYLTINVGYSLVVGYAGQISLCQGAFAAIGAYLTALLALRLGLPVWLTLLLAPSLTAVVGLVIAIPALRLSGHYLALVTLGFNTIVEIVLRVWVSMTNGPYGLSVPKLALGSFAVGNDARLLYLNYAVALASVWVCWNLVRSRTGRAFTAVRGSEIAAVSLGINVARTKSLAFGLSAFFGGLGGGLFAVTIGLVSPDDFGLPKVLAFLTMLIVGGLGSLAGTIVGTAVLTMLPEALRFLKDYEELMYGILLLLALNRMPKGIVGLARDLRRRFGPRERAFVVQGDTPSWPPRF